jgi:hypothetical protein
MFTTGISSRIGLVVPTPEDLFTLDSRSREPKIDNGIPHVTSRGPTGFPRRLSLCENMFSEERKGTPNMNSQILGLRIASIIFGLMSLAQLLRLVIQPEVLVAGHQMPLWPSVLAFVILGGLSIWLWKLSSIPR